MCMQLSGQFLAFAEASAQLVAERIVAVLGRRPGKRAQFVHDRFAVLVQQLSSNLTSSTSPMNWTWRSNSWISSTLHPNTHGSSATYGASTRVERSAVTPATETGPGATHCCTLVTLYSRSASRPCITAKATSTKSEDSPARASPLVKGDNFGSEPTQ